MPPIETLYVIHHSHTDIGFTHDQPIVWELHGRFIDQALNVIEAHAGEAAPESRFRWTVETTGVLDHWLRQAPAADIERLLRAERAGLLEVTAMFANITPLYDLTQLVESLQGLRRLRAEYGLTITAAMNCDVNGQNWPLVDVLLDAGISRFAMAINPAYGGAPEPRPNLFHWQGPSGRRLLTYNGWHYAHGLDFGMADATTMRFESWWARIVPHLAQAHYPLPCLMVHAIHPFGDNGGPYEQYAEFARRWNALGRAPRIVMATPSQWWAAVEPHAAVLPTWRGDWTDFWNFGAGSTARAMATHRASRTRLLNADALYAAGRALPRDTAPGQAWAERSMARYRGAAWQALNLWAEHTWGADTAVEAPALEDSVSQHAHKQAYAYQARSLSLLLQREALADLAQHVARTAPDDLLLFNPLPWPRTLAGHIDSNTFNPRGHAADTASGRHFQGHSATATGINTGRIPEHMSGNWGYYLPPTPVPAFGYVTVPRSAIHKADLQPTPTAPGQAGAEPVIENARFRLEFDPVGGGLRSLYDKQLDWEWADPDAGRPLHSFVHETLADPHDSNPRERQHHIDWRATLDSPSYWQPQWAAARTGPTGVLSQRVYRTELGVAVEQTLRHARVQGLVQRVFLPAGEDYVECEAEWDMGPGDFPEATYVLFPFNLPGASVRLNVGGVAIEPERDQLPGVCRDYFTVQDWLDFNDGQRGMVVGLPDNPLVQLGDFHFGHDQQQFRLERAQLLGWVTNNYWMTNFQAAQPGRVHARYRLWTYAGAFDEARGHRCGTEAAHARVLAQHLGEPAAATTPWPASGSLLALPSAPILTLQVKAGAQPGRLQLRLWNASDTPQTAVVGSGLLRIGRAEQCDLFGQPEAEIAVAGGVAQLRLPPRRVVVVALHVTA
jgi:alpha-mannosidase